jgi:hypothetical protein
MQPSKQNSMKISNKTSNQARNFFVVLMIAYGLIVAVVLSQSTFAVPIAIANPWIRTSVMAFLFVGFIFFHGLLHFRLLDELDKTEKLIALSEEVDVALVAQVK